LIQLTRRGVVFTGGQEELAFLREKYDRENHVILPQLYELALLEEIVRRVEGARFVPGDYNDVAVESTMDDRPAVAMLLFFPNIPAFLRLVEQITGHPRIGCFNGRVYRMTPSAGQHQHWHDDADPERVVTMSVNLSRHAFEGGALQMKRRDSAETMPEVRNTGFGDALLFRVSPDLVHRVEEVRGEVSKTAFAGWFLDVEDVLPNFRNSPGSSAPRPSNG